MRDVYVPNVLYNVNTKQQKFEVPVYWGYASRSLAIDSSINRYRVMAVPQLTIKAELLTGQEAIQAGHNYIQATRFELVSGLLGTVNSVIQVVQETLSDEDGDTLK
jgi:hypothetical protein